MRWSASRSGAAGLVCALAVIVACDAGRSTSTPVPTSGTASTPTTAAEGRSTARAAATVVERFSTPNPPAVSSKTGLPLPTAGPPRGAPPTPTPDPNATPAAFGPFRLIPPGWEGEATSEVLPLPEGMIVTSDPAEVPRSPLYRAVPDHLLRGDLGLVSAEAGTVGVVLSFRSATDPNLSLMVVRRAPTTLPENRRVFGGTRTLVVDGRYVIVNDSYPPGPVAGLPPGSEFRPYRITVLAGAGGVMAMVQGVGYDEATLIEIAKVLVP